MLLFAQTLHESVDGAPPSYVGVTIVCDGVPGICVVPAPPLEDHGRTNMKCQK